MATANGRITLLVPAPPGGPLDRFARILAPLLQEELRQSVIVDNRAGASGKIGVHAALRSPRDGTTLLVVSPTVITVSPVVDKAIGFDPLKDLEHLGIGASNSGVFAVRGGFPATSMVTFLANVKSTRVQPTYASFGIGSSLHLHSEELLGTLGIEATHVPYKGEAQALTALAAGEVDMMAYVTSSVLPHIESGRIRALAATSTARWNLLPQVPSFAESGVPELKEYNYRSWVGVCLPTGADRTVKERLASSYRAVLSRESFAKALVLQGYDLHMDAESMRDVVAREISRNRRLVSSGRVKLD